MSKIKRGCKRSICVVMLSLMLSQTYIGAYMTAEQMPRVEAADLASSALRTLLMYTFASSGVSSKSSAENDACANAFQRWWSSAKKTIKDINADAVDREMANLETYGKGSIFIPSSVKNLQKAMLLFKTDYLSTRNKSTHALPLMKLFNAEGFVTRNDLKNFIYSYLGNEVSLDFSSTVYFVSIKKIPSAFKDARGSIYSNGYFISIGSNPYLYPNYNGTGSCYLRRLNGSITCNYASDDRVYTSSGFQSMCFGYSDSLKQFERCTVTSNTSTFCYLLKSFTLESKFVGNIYSKARIFTSADNLFSVSDVDNALGDYSGLYGDDEASVALSDSVTVGDYSLLNSINQAITNVGENVSAEDINTIVQANIKDYSETLEDINESISTTNSGIAVSNNWLSKIYSQIVSMSNSMTDGSSAKSLDDADAFQVIDGGGQPDPDDNDPKVWFGGTFLAASFLKPLMEYFTEPLSLLTKWQKAIKEALETSTEQQVEAINAQNESTLNFLEYVKGIPAQIWSHFEVTLGGIITSLGDLVGLASQALSALQNMAGDIGAQFKAGLQEALSEPVDVKLLDPVISGGTSNDPFVFDYSLLQTMVKLLTQIAGNLEEFFKFDTVAVQASCEAFKLDIGDKLSLNGFSALVDSASIKDDRSYPVIKMKTPDILKQFVHSNELILFNGEDFANYFVWIRLLLQAILWVGFAYALLKKFKVHLTLD